MYAMFAITFLLAIFAGFHLGTSHDRDLAAGQASAEAAQMVAYHQAALKRCRTVGCAIGTINANPYLPTQMRNLPAYTDGRYRAVSNGNNLVWTYYRGHSGAGSKDSFGLVNQALIKETEDLLTFGPYDAAAQRVPSRRAFDGTAAAPVSVANGVGGNNIQDESPVIVSRWR